MPKREKYHCTKCRGNHYLDSKIGRNHTDHKMEEFFCTECNQMHQYDKKIGKNHWKYREKKYFCTECHKTHYSDSGVGYKHREYKQKTKEVFICYPRKDDKIAFQICESLEKRNLFCWIAPRNVGSGEYAASIVRAIEDAKIMVFVFTKNANESPHIRRELELAVKNNIPIIPFRIDDMDPNKAIEYCISSMHRIDAFTPPLENHISELVQKVRNILF